MVVTYIAQTGRSRARIIDAPLSLRLSNALVSYASLTFPDHLAGATWVFTIRFLLQVCQSGARRRLCSGRRYTAIAASGRRVSAISDHGMVLFLEPWFR
jgi:hypothetical protein